MHASFGGRAGRHQHAINFFERINAAQIQAAERAKVERENSISFVQSQISAHQKSNLESPDNQMILEWCKEIVSSGNSGGLTVRKLFQEATKDLGEPDQSTIDDQKSEVQSMYDLGGPINPEALAGRFDRLLPSPENDVAVTTPAMTAPLLPKLTPIPGILK